MVMRHAIAVVAFGLIAALAGAQAPSRAEPRRAPAPTGTLAQVMRGVYFPNANLIFDVQQNDPAAPKKKSSETGGSATDTYSAAYSGWDVVENADFQKFARDMRAAGQKVLAAARTKNQEKVSDATNDLADACASCHEIYRDTGPADSAARCTPPSKK